MWAGAARDGASASGPSGCAASLTHRARGRPKPAGTPLRPFQDGPVSQHFLRRAGPAGLGSLSLGTGFPPLGSRRVLRVARPSCRCPAAQDWSPPSAPPLPRSRLGSGPRPSPRLAGRHSTDCRNLGVARAPLEQAPPSAPSTPPPERRVRGPCSHVTQGRAAAPSCPVRVRHVPRNPSSSRERFRERVVLPLVAVTGAQ